MVQERTILHGRFPSAPPARPSVRSVRARRPSISSVAPEDIQDLLGAITDRPDLERLYARHVALPSIVRLMGHQVSREQIHDLLSSQHLEQELKKLL